MGQANPQRKEYYYELLSPEVKEALTVFTEAERNSLCASYDEHGNFLGIGCESDDGYFVKYADPDKRQAIQVLEKEYLKEQSL